MSILPFAFGLKGMAIAGVIGFAAGGYAAYRITDAFGDAAVLRLEKAADAKTIADQNATIEALNEASRHSSRLAELERDRADRSIDAALQKEADDAAAASAANAAHRPDACNYTDDELGGLRKRLR